MWKLGCEERRFPVTFPLGTRLVWPVVLNQLLYRYERECVVSFSEWNTRLCWLVSSECPTCCLQRGHRSAVSAILARHEKADRFGVFVVCAVRCNPPGVDLSDGWYAVSASLDEPLGALARKGALSVGMKLAVCGAELKGVAPNTAVHPLSLEVNRVHQHLQWSAQRLADGPPEVSTQAELALHFNSTRPAR